MFSTAEMDSMDIKYGDLTWIKSARRDGCDEYIAVSPDVGSFRVSQYPMNESWCAGQWHWSVSFQYLSREFLPRVLKMEASSILETREEAMLACLDAKAAFIDDMQQLLAILRPGDEYAQGRRAGQEEIKQRVIDFLQ